MSRRNSAGAVSGVSKHLGKTLASKIYEDIKFPKTSHRGTYASEGTVEVICFVDDVHHREPSEEAAAARLLSCRGG